jgi:hypothetical protein
MEDLEPNVRYVGELGIELKKQTWFFPIPKSCRCNKGRYVGTKEATRFVEQGKAVWALYRKDGEMQIDERMIWMPVVKERVPRVDMISRADVERAYIGSELRSGHYVYDRKKQKFVVIGTMPEGINKAEWAADAEAEVKHEKNIRKKFSQDIEECHGMILWSRIQCGRTRTVVRNGLERCEGKWGIPLDDKSYTIRAERKDPFEGRSLLPFSPESRTFGGH